jgi:4-amino-4-deoxy-L-arabinose transferase-like glycosyltransferase
MQGQNLTSHLDQPRDTRADTAVLVALALFVLILHILTNGQYGFHRDELALLDDAHYLAWGYVAYPPVTPLLGRVSLELFGHSLRGARFFPALAQAIAVLLSGLMARELGGKRLAQFVAALAAAIAPMALTSGSLLQYITFDYLWWVLVSYLLVRLLRTENPSWWLAVGAAVGLGMLTKYTMIFLVAGIVVGLLSTNARRYLKSPWLWAGAAVSLLIFLPNLIWQIRNDFISLEFLRQIHERDILLGRPQAFLPEQVWIVANPITIPLWLAGLLFYFLGDAAKPFRVIGWMFIVPFVLFLAMKGRGYYIAPAYPMLLAAGAVVEERWLASMRIGWARVWRAITLAVLVIGGVLIAAAALPMAPVGSRWFRAVSRVNGYFREEIGWPELVAQVASIRDSLPADEIGQAAILAANYGEAGAINMYGPAFGLPKAISGMNSYWARGYGDPPPQILIVLGFSRKNVDQFFTSCELAGRTTNKFRVLNEETRDHPYIFVCRKLRYDWPEFWKEFRYYG